MFGLGLKFVPLVIAILIIIGAGAIIVSQTPKYVPKTSQEMQAPPEVKMPSKTPQQEAFVAIDESYSTGNKPDSASTSPYDRAPSITRELAEQNSSSVGVEIPDGGIIIEADELECPSYSCFATHYQNLVKNDGVKIAYADLRARYDKSTYVKAVCHPLTHAIGRQAAKKYANVAEAFQRGDYFCWSGYFHGVMEGLLRDVSKNDIPTIIPSICDTIPGKESYSFDYYNCVHGLGHGVMYITNNELFEALRLCNNLRVTGRWEQTSCWGGVFMENVIADLDIDNNYHSTKYLKPEDPLYPCNAVEEQYRNSCYMMQTSYMLKVKNYNFSEVFDLCGLADQKYQNICYQSIGRDASGSTRSNVERTKNYCMLGEEFTQQSNCVIGAVKDFISYLHSDVRAKELCQALPENLQSICTNTAKSYYKTF